MNHPTARTAPPKLVLEPVRANSSIRSFPLAPGRYLIGSADDCDLVVPVGGVAPQHCLIVVGTNRTIVKALSPLTWIDDGPLTESVLQLGQKLIIGPVELRTRRPDVSEWLEDSEEPSSPAVAGPAAYQPPQIEELLDRARQQLDTALADELPASETWAEDLPLSEAVDRHAQAAQSDSSEHLRSAELERKELELNERSCSIEYLTSELTAREQALLARESAVVQEQAHLGQQLAELNSREQALQEREQTLLAWDTRSTEIRQQLESQQQELFVRDQKQEESLATVELQSQELASFQSQLIEQQSDLDRSRAELLQREELLAVQLAEFQHRQSEVAHHDHQLAEREQGWRSRESELVARIQQLEIQLQSPPSAPASSPFELLSSEALAGREDDLRYREESATRRETMLAQSLAALKTSQEQLREEAEQIEARFSDLMQREQALPARLTALQADVQQTETCLAELRQQQADQLKLVQARELALESRLTAITEREGQFQQTQKSQETRERELRNLRSELDIREEALEQQYAQLQLDRSTLKAAQTRLQLAEQSLQQRETPQIDPTLSAREVAVAGQAQALEERLAELHSREQQLNQLAEQMSQQAAEFVDEKSRLSASWAELEGLRQEQDARHLLVNSPPAPMADGQVTQDEIARQLQSLVEEREALSRLREDLLEEQQGLKAERDELRRVRQQFDQEREQFQVLKQEAQTERDTFLLERQEIITERQALRDRERQLLAKEAEATRHAEEVLSEREVVTLSQSRLEEERVHLNEEWDVLRQERAELAEVQASLDAQRDELSAVALEMAQLQHGLSDEVVESPRADAEPPHEAAVPVADDPEKELAAAPETVSDEVGAAVVDEAEAEWNEPVEDEEPELAGLSSFSSIGQFSDEGIPPEVAEILRRTAGQHVTAPPPPAPASGSLTSRLDAMLGRKPASADSEVEEQRRVKELLASPTSDFVDEASQSMHSEEELEESDSYAGDDEVPTTSEYDSESEMVAEVPVKEPEAPTRPNDDIRSRLSEMFGINLGGNKSAPAPVAPPEPVVEEVYEEEGAAEECDEQEQFDQEPVAEEPSNPNLDPVAAYMEQLLARTRKGKTEAAPAPAPAPKKEVAAAPVEVAPVAPVKVEPVIKAPEPEPEPAEVQRVPRKLDRAEKEALRANLDSFRTIANSQARSDVARSELRRLKVTVKVKRVFVGVSAVIGLVLLSTLAWSDKGYYLEILAAIIATAFLSVDFVRTEKRLRELANTMPEDDEPVIF